MWKVWLVMAALSALAGCASRDRGGGFGGNKVPDAEVDADDGDGGDELPFAFGVINGSANANPFEDVGDINFFVDSIEDDFHVAQIDISREDDGCKRAGQSMGTDWRVLRLTLTRKGNAAFTTGTYPVQLPSVMDRPDLYATARVIDRAFGLGDTSTLGETGAVVVTQLGANKIAGTFTVGMEDMNGSVTGSFDTERKCAALEADP